MVVSENDKIATAYDLTDLNTLPGEEISVVRVICHQLGETDIKLIVSNKPTTANCKAQSASATARISCGKPSKLVLQPNFQTAANCPMDMSSGNVVIPTFKEMDFDILVYNDCGHRFLNISSLLFTWALTPSKAGKFASKDGSFPNDFMYENIPISDKAYQTLFLQSEFKQLSINTSLIGYNKKVLKRLNIIPENPPFKDPGDKEQYIIDASLSLYLVDPAIIEPYIALYNHPGNRKRIPVTQGSGFFEISLSNKDLANVKYIEATKEIEIMPKRSGELIINLNDLCLVTKPAMMMVNVVSVGLIRVEMIDKVETGKCIKCVVRLFDENDNLMDLPDKNMIGITPILEAKIANVAEDVEDPKNPWGVGEVHFLISGVNVGDTRLIFTVAGGDEDIRSAPVDLQVFNPLKIHPRNGTILIKSHLQVVATGGPHPDTNIEFTVINPNKVQGKHIIFYVK